MNTTILHLILHLHIAYIFVKPYLRTIILRTNILITQKLLLEFLFGYIKMFNKITFKTDVCFDTRHSLSSTKNVGHFKMYSLNSLGTIEEM